MPAYDIATIRRMGANFLRQFRLAADYKDVFGDDAGRRVLHDILRRGAILSTPMVAGDPHLSAFNMGRQSLAQEIVDKLRWDAEALIRLAAEREESAEPMFGGVA